MTSYGAWVLGGAALLVIFVILEGRRQARKYGAPSKRPNLMGAGLLEVQRHLQADRKVEVMQRQVRDEVAEQDEDARGEPPRPPSEPSPR